MNAKLRGDLARSVLESAPDAIVIVDDAGVIIYTNRQVDTLFGFEEAELVGSPVEQLMPERYRSKHVGNRHDFSNSLRTRPMGVGLDLRARRKDGSEFPVEISLSPIHEQGRTMVAAAIRDATERRQVETELRRAQAESERMVRAKSRFLATASHDLRQPLQALALLNGALRRMTDTEDQREAVDEQEQAISTMSSLLASLLDISKLESGAVQPELGVVAVREIFEQLRSDFAPTARRRRLGFKVECGSECIRTDRALMLQALSNLLSNAFKFTPQGTVELSSCLVDSDVCIEVRDTGVGIAREQVDFIFDEFYQVGVSSRSSREGYGLGLSIVNHVAHVLGVQVQVNSVEGQGSTFAIRLPAAREVTPIQAGPSTTSQLTSDGRRHVLLVEDDVGVRNATRVFLKSEGYRVSVAGTLEEARIALTSGVAFDLLITDYHLDDNHTGSEVIAIGREALGPLLRAVIVTGDTSSAMQVIALDPHTRIASKPVNSAELLQAMNHLL